MPCACRVNWRHWRLWEKSSGLGSSQASGDAGTWVGVADGSGDGGGVGVGVGVGSGVGVSVAVAVGVGVGVGPDESVGVGPTGGVITFTSLKS